MLIQLTPKEPKFKLPSLLLEQQIPMPLHGVNPRTILGNKWWDKERHKAYERNNNHCWACGTHRDDALFHKWLEGHEIYERDYSKGILIFKEVCALCPACHMYIHSGRLQALVNRRVIKESDALYVLKRGDAIIYESGLTKPNVPDEANSIPWNDWRMVIEGNEYAPVLKSIDEWRRYHNESD